MNPDNDVYRKLRQQIDKMPVGMPTTDSGVEIRILKHLFTPNEAKIALHLNIFPEPVERIYHRIIKTDQNVTIEELEEVLDRLVLKGSILCDEKDGKRLYSYALFAVGMHEFQVDRLTEEFYESCVEYIQGEFRKEITRTNIPQFRVVPVEKSISPEQYIATYDDIRDVITNTDGQLGVLNCLCKQGKDLIGQKCQTTDIRETCIIVPSSTSIIQQSIDQFRSSGRMRLITKEETLEILQRAEDEGLVIQPSNALEPFVICCCCGDCCAVLTAAKKFPKPSEMFATNYYAEVDRNLCSGCENCLKRCQMEAPTIQDGKASINLDHCIGCGLCVTRCPPQAITLRKKNKETKPPKTPEKLYKKILAKKVGHWGMMKIGIKKLLRQKV